MDTLIIQIQVNDEMVNHIIFQSDTVSGAAANAISKPFRVDELPAEFQTAYHAFIDQAANSYDQIVGQLQEDYYVDVDISPDPVDATITRKAYANIPVEQGNQTFIMPVVVKHFQNGQYAGRIRKDFSETLIGSNERTVDVNGTPVGEYDYFKQASKTTPMPELMIATILAEDAKGRFNRVSTPAGGAE